MNPFARVIMILLVLFTIFSQYQMNESHKRNKIYEDRFDDITYNSRIYNKKFEAILKDLKLLEYRLDSLHTDVIINTQYINEIRGK